MKDGPHLAWWLAALIVSVMMWAGLISLIMGVLN